LKKPLSDLFAPLRLCVSYLLSQREISRKGAKEDKALDARPSL
jgi:hypothetical protein